MDYRQYDNALGRFNSIDVLAETSYSITPYHFGYNNPNYWSDPTGLISQAAIDAMWNNSANNASTTWTNNGGSNFDSSSGNGWVNADSGTFNEYSESLSEVTIYGGKGSSRDKSNNGTIEGHLYWKGKYYQNFRDDQFSGQLNDMQSMFDAVGTIDPTGIVDGLNALGYLARGQKANAAIAAIGIIPYLGDAAKGIKYTKSTLKIGQEMHSAYKVADEVAGVAMKEYRGIKGIRPDFVDFGTKTIFELKPFNPRAMKAGEKQLKNYKAAFEAKYPGTVWNTVLDTY